MAAAVLAFLRLVFIFVLFFAGRLLKSIPEISAFLSTIVGSCAHGEGFVKTEVQV